MNRITVLSLAILLCAASLAEAQRRGGGNSSLSNDIMLRVLQNSDANRDGMLSPSETSTRTKDFIRKAGLDPNRPHTLQTIAQKAKSESDKKESDNARSSRSRSTNETPGSVEPSRRVPGFGIDTERLGVSDFSPTGEERMTVDAMKRKFGESIMAQVERTMSRYDTDKNGLIDTNEQRRTRWTNPSAAESDMNNDSNLSRVELAYRYKNREDVAFKRTKPTSNSSSRSVSTKKAVSPPKTFSNRSSSSSRSSSYRSNSRTNVSRNSSRTSGRSSSTSKPFNSGSDAYKRYAEGLLKNYDKNKDQKLSRSELKEMRRPPEKADTNGDGFVDKNELIASVSKRSGGSSTASPSRTSTASRDRNTRSNKGMQRLRRESKSSNQHDNVFGGRDTNSDGQLQMSEFEEEWDEEKVAEFKEKDLNGDGVITAKEWHSRTP